MAEGKTATWSLNLEGNVSDVAKRDRAELEQLRTKIEQSKDAIKGLVATQQALRGSSDQIKKAKDELKARIEAERGAISRATLAIHEQGKSLKDFTRQTKDQTGALSAMTEGLGGLLGPAAAVVGVVGAVGAAVGAASVKIGEMILKNADWLRSLGLVREAATGSAENADALGTQVDDLAHRVATSKEKLNELGSSIAKNLSGGLSRASGQTIVDTFNAVAEAGAAMGDQVGSTLEGLIDRGKMWNRFSLSPQDLQGTQLQFQEVAQSLAKNLNIGIQEARTALFQGRVPLEAGAKALRDAVENRFGDVNAKKLLSLGTQIDKLQERFRSLAAGVEPLLDPILKGLSHVFELFDDTTSSGETLEGIFKFIGQVIADISPDVFDEMKVGIEEAEGAGLDLIIWLQGINADLKDYGGFWGIAKDSMAAAVEVAKIAIAPFKLLAEAIGGYIHYASQLNAGDVEASAEGAGTAAGDGLANGIAAGKGKVHDAAADLAAAASSGYADALQIQSPSKVFEEHGRQTAAGAERGMAGGAPGVQSAADDMAPSPGARGDAGGGGGAAGVDVTVNLILNFPESMGKEKASELANKMQQPSFMGQLTRAVREAMLTAGVPTQAGAAP